MSNTQASINAKRAEWDAKQRAGRIFASKVGKAMAKSSIPKASRYKSFGRDQDGYAVASTTTGTVYVCTTHDYQAGIDQAWAIHAHLTAAGFDVEEPRVIAGHVGSMEVKGMISG